jgi:hypothetical protein
VKPGFTKPEMYLPLSARAALAWYMRTQYTAISPLRHVGRFVLGCMARRGTQALGSFIKTYVVTGVREGAPRLTGGVFRAQSCLPVDGLQTPCWPTMLTGGPDDRSRVVLLPFGRTSPEPELVLKFARSAASAENNRHEQRVLAEVTRDLTPTRLRATVPQPAGTFTCDSMLVSIEKYLSGASLSRSIGCWGRPLSKKVADLKAAGDWLAAFHGATGLSRTTWNMSTEAEWLEAPLLAYAAAFGLTDPERLGFDAARACSRSLHGRSMPIVWQHHDFGEWNVQRDAHSIRVIDWERARRGLPLCDLLYFATFWYFSVRGLRRPLRQLTGFARLNTDPGQVTDVAIRAVNAVVEAYRANLRVDREFVPLLVLVTWVGHALDRWEREGPVPGDRGNTRGQNAYVDFVEVLASHLRFCPAPRGTRPG